METTDKTIEVQTPEVAPSPTIVPMQPDAVTSTPILPIQKSRRRTGNVAMLPVDLRQFVNESLDNGATYKAIAAELTTKGHPISKGSIGEWARGGYKDYLREKERNTLIREQSDKIINTAVNVSDASRAAFEKISANIVASKILDTIHDFNTGLLRETLEKRPELFFRAAKIVNLQSMDFSRLRRVELLYKKYDDDTAEQRRIEEAKNNPDQHGLTPEQLKEIEAVMATL
jgi:hypothetical protein